MQHNKVPFLLKLQSFIEGMKPFIITGITTGLLCFIIKAVPFLPEQMVCSSCGNRSYFQRLQFGAYHQDLVHGALLLPSERHVRLTTWRAHP